MTAPTRAPDPKKHQKMIPKHVFFEHFGGDFRCLGHPSSTYFDSPWWPRRCTVPCGFWREVASPAFPSKDKTEASSSLLPPDGLLYQGLYGTTGPGTKEPTTPGFYKRPVALWVPIGQWCQNPLRGTSEQCMSKKRLAVIISVTFGVTNIGVLCVLV